MLEKDMENLIARYPDEFFPGAGFKFEGQQVNLGRCYVDIIFKDKYERKIIVEIKRGVLSRKAAGQIMEYYGLVKKQEGKQPVELILCGNNIPFERKTFLENVGIECKEIRESLFNEVAKKYNYEFIDNVSSPQISSSDSAMFTRFSNTKINLHGLYDSVEAFEKIILSGGSGRSRADTLYRNLLKLIKKAKSEGQDLVVNSPEICNDIHFGTRTRKFIKYICEEKQNMMAINFKKSEANFRKFSSFTLTFPTNNNN